MSTEPRRLGKYEMRERLARGGQGEVWKAFDPQLHRYVAIKQLNANFKDDPDFVARFEREAQFIAALRHPNIVQIHDFQFARTADTNISTAYMVMDYIEGPTLADYIRTTSRKGQFPSAADIVTIFTAVSLALDYAHQQGMVHRDIKPANIMLDQRNPSDRPLGKPVLMDFGIAKLQSGSADTTKVLGTPLYVSPEQAQGLSGDGRSDLYSLGIILYEITTGVTPFRGESLVAILMRHYQDIPTPPNLINPDISPELSAVILKSIAKAPEARFPSASAMTSALAEALRVPVPPELRRASMIPAPIATQEHTIATPFAHAMTPVPPVSSSFHSSPNLAPLSPLAFPATQVSAPHTPVTPPPVKRPKKRLVLLVSSVVLLVILGLGLVAFFAPKGSSSVPANKVFGQLLFLSSQHPSNSLDIVQMNVAQISDASAGKSYYAWLETHNDSLAPIHWSLTVHNGSLSPPSYTDPQHQNLLTSQPYLLLITLQSGNTEVPSFDAKDRFYYASIPQEKSATDKYSLVDHLNHLLTDDPALDTFKLSYGSQYWLLQNTQALVQEVNSAKDAWQNKKLAQLRQHLVNSLYYLEGTSCAAPDVRATPQPNTPTIPNTQSVSVSLLDCPQNTALPGLLSHSGLDTRGVTQAPGATQHQTALASQIQTNVTQTTGWLKQLQQDILQSIKLPDNQLLQAFADQINQMATLAHQAYSGQTTLSHSGVQQMSNDAQHLASFDILSCPQSAANNICMS